ncbi:MAG: DUF3828 domain-containing protein [Anaerolineales bacterium]|nr:DUF3828 domain-containing protein [Anaerolineales bacterium]
MEAGKLGLAAVGIGLALCLVASGCQRGAQASEEPGVVVESFYKWYLAYPGNVSAERAYRSSEYVTEGFIQVMDQTLGAEGSFIPADPIICAQDFPQSFTLGETRVTGRDATVVLREAWNAGTRFEMAHDLTIALRLVDGAWKIDRIACPQPPSAQAQPAAPAEPTVAPTASAPEPTTPALAEPEATEAPDGPAAIAGWTTFRCEEYGFELQHPPDWTVMELPVTQPDLMAPIVRIVQLLPQAWAEQLGAGGPPDPEAPVIVAPLSVEVSVGSLEAYRRMYADPASSEQTEINGYPARVERDAPGDFALIRTVLQHPVNADLRVTTVDQLSGFSTRAAEHPEEIALAQQILTTWRWVD